MAWPAAVLLDVGGVLLLPAPELMLPALAGTTPPVATLDRAHYRALPAATRGGTVDWDEYFRVYATTAGVPPSRLLHAIAALHEVFGGCNWTRVVPGAAAMLETLRAAGVRIGVVSNSDGSVEKTLRHVSLCQVGPGPGVPVDVILDSAVLGLEKPDPRVFTHTLGLLDVDPREAVHIGDSVHADVDGAFAAGVRVLHFTPYGDCEPTERPHQHLTRLGDLERMIGRGGNGR